MSSETSPGYRLKLLIPDFFASSGCGCEGYARQMNAWGKEGCRRRFDEIVDHLASQADRIGYLKVVPRFVLRNLIERLVRRAIEGA